MKTERSGIKCWMIGVGLVAAAMVTTFAKAAAGDPPPPPPPPHDRQMQDGDQPDQPRDPMAGPRRGPRDRRPMNPQQRQEMRRRAMERRGMNPGDEAMRVPDEMVDWVMEAMKTRLPRVYERLSKLRQENPKRFQFAIRKLVPFLLEYRSLQENNPELAESVLQEFQAEDRLRELSKDYLSAKDDAAKQASAAQEIEQLVRKQFELRRKRFEARLLDFEDRIKDQQLQLQMMRDRVQAVQARQEDLVARRVSQVKNGRMGEGLPQLPDPLGDPGMDGPRPPGGDQSGERGNRPLPRPDGRRRPGTPQPPPDDDMPPHPPDHPDGGPPPEDMDY